MSPIEMIAKNVRIQMKKRDVTETHVVHKLKLEADKLKARLNGRIPFSDEELEILAPYLDTTFEALHLDPEVFLNGKSSGKPSVSSVKVSENTTIESAPFALIGITDRRDDLRELLTKMFMARLSGKIDDLGYYLRNNILIKALKDYIGPITEEEKVVYVNHYLAKFEQWKRNLVSDIEDVTEVALTTNQLEGVQAVILPSGKNRLTQFLGMMAKDCTGDDKITVDIQRLAMEVDKAVGHLKKVSGLLVDYMVNHGVK